MGPAPLAPHVTIPMWVRGERPAAPLSPGKPATPPVVSPEKPAAPEPMNGVEKQDGPAPMADVTPALPEEPEITPQENGIAAATTGPDSNDVADAEMQAVGEEDEEGSSVPQEQPEEQGQSEAEGQGSGVEQEQNDQLDIEPEGVDNDGIELPTAGPEPDSLALSGDLAQPDNLAPSPALPLEDGDIDGTLEDPPDIAAIGPEQVPLDDVTADGTVVHPGVNADASDTTMLDDGKVAE